MAPRGFNISAPWRHWPDRDVSRRIPGQTLRHCHDACIAPDHGAGKAVRARAVSGVAHPEAGRGIRQWAGGRVRGMGVAGRQAVPVGQDVLPESPRVENRTGGFPAGAECAALLLSGRHDKVSDRRAPWRHVAAQGWARAGPASAGMCRSRRRAGRKEPVLVRSFLVRKIPTRRACSSFRHAVGFTRHVDPDLRSSARNGCSRRHWVGFQCVRIRVGFPLSYALSHAPLPCAFAISRRAAGFARRALCFACALAACLEFSALDPVLPVAFLFRRT